LGTPKRRLELRFRPADIYCKPAYGEPGPTCGFLIKLRRRKSGPKEIPKSPEPPNLTDLSHLPDPPPEDNPTNVLGSSLLSSPISTDYKIIRDEDQQFILFDGPLPADLRASMSKAVENKETPPSRAFQANGAMILAEEQKFLEELTLKKRVERAIDGGTFFTPQFGQGGNRNRIYVKVPEKLSDIRAPSSDFHVEVLGVVPRSYKFNG